MYNPVNYDEFWTNFERQHTCARQALAPSATAGVSGQRFSGEAVSVDTGRRV